MMTHGSVITNKGFAVLMDRFWNDDGETSYTAPSKFMVGINNGIPNVTDTALANPVPIAGTESIDNFDVDTNWVAGTDSSVVETTTRYKEGVGCLSLAKIGTTGTTMSMSKTTGSLDFTSKDFWGWVYITDLSDLVSSGTAITIRFGSASDAYYYFNIDILSLNVGWNIIKFNANTATGMIGSPMINACDYTAIICNVDLATDTIAADRVFFDDFRLVSADDYMKAFASGYPIITESTKEVEVQCYLASAQASGFDINGFCIVNTDGTPLMTSEDSFQGESKGVDDEFLFIVKDRYI